MEDISNMIKKQNIKHTYTDIHYIYIYINKSLSHDLLSVILQTLCRSSEQRFENIDRGYWRVG